MECSVGWPTIATWTETSDGWCPDSRMPGFASTNFTWKRRRARTDICRAAWRPSELAGPRPRQQQCRRPNAGRNLTMTRTALLVLVLRVLGISGLFALVAVFMPFDGMLAV